MKTITIRLSVLAITALLAAGCKPKDSVTQELATAQEKSAQAAQDMKDYTFAQKAEFVSFMQDRLAAFNRDLDELGAKIAGSSEAVKAEAQPKLNAMRAQSTLLSKQLDVAKNATASSWELVKTDFRKSYDASRSGFKQAREWLSEKIKP